MSTRSFVIHFRVPGATEPDDFAVRAYDDERLADIALLGPDDDGVFDAEFDREADSVAVALQMAIGDLAAVFPEAEMLRAEVRDHVAGAPGR